MAGGIIFSSSGSISSAPLSQASAMNMSTGNIAAPLLNGSTISGDSNHHSRHWTNINININIFMYIYTCMYVYIYLSIYVSIYTYTYICISSYLYPPNGDHKKWQFWYSHHPGAKNGRLRESLDVFINLLPQHPKIPWEIWDRSAINRV